MSKFRTPGNVLDRISSIESRLRTLETVARKGAQAEVTGAPDNATFVTIAAEALLTAETRFKDLILEGTFAARPSAAIEGRLYYATDTEVLYRDTGIGWTTVSTGSGGAPDDATFITIAAEAGLTNETRFKDLILQGTYVARPAAGQEGRLYFATDIEVMYRDTGVAWTILPFNLVYNVKAYGATGDGTTTDTTAIQNCINASVSGSYIWFPGGTYLVDAPLTAEGDRTFIGAGWGRNTTYPGSMLKIKSGATAATWKKKGIITSEAYLGTDSKQGGDAYAPTGPICVSNLILSAGGQTVGNAIVLMNWPCIIDKIQIQDFNGTAAWDELTNGGDGQGYGIVLSGYGFDGTAMTANCVQTRILHSRIETRNTKILAVNGGTNLWTDATIFDVEFLKQSTAFETPDMDVKSSGGWIVAMNHTNASGGDGFRFRALGPNTVIYGNILDGWGEISGGGTYYAIRCDNKASGGGGHTSTLIANNTFRYRDTQDSGTFIAFKLANTGSEDGVYDLVGNVGQIRDGGTGTQKAFNISSTSVELTVNLTANEFADITDANVFHNSSWSNVIVHDENNWFNNGTAAPTGGNWFQGAYRRNTAPTNPGIDKWICFVAGAPGTWVEVHILEAFVRVAALDVGGVGYTPNTATQIVGGTVKGGMLAAGTLYELHIAGNIDARSATPGTTYTFKLRYGGTTIKATAVTALSATSQTAKAFTLQGMFWVTTPGASSTLNGSLHLTENISNAAIRFVQAASSTTSSVSTTTDQTLEVTVELDVADAASVVHVTGGYLKAVAY